MHSQQPRLGHAILVTSDTLVVLIVDTLWERAGKASSVQVAACVTIVEVLRIGFCWSAPRQLLARRLVARVGRSTC